MYKLLLIAALLLAVGQTQAQAPNTGGPTPGPSTPAAVPLDGGASILLASGVALGVRHLRARRRAKS